MNLIQYLQQGGYVLPQLSRGQLTYDVPDSGNQMLNQFQSMDNSFFQRDMQREQLLLQKSQQNQSAFNSVFQNRLAKAREDRVNKQTDLTNKRLEFEMMKEKNNILDEMIKFTEDNVENRDKAKMESIFKKEGYDVENILKSDLDLMGTMKANQMRKQLYYAQKDIINTKQSVADGKSILTEAEENYKRIDAQMKSGVPINVDNLIGYNDALAKAHAELADYREGTLNSMDLTAPHWAALKQYPNLIDQEMYKEQLQSKQLVTQSEIAKDIATAEFTKVKALELQQQAELDKQMAPVKMMEAQLKGLNATLEQADVITKIGEVIPGIKITNGQELFDALQNITPDQRARLLKVFEEDNAKKGGGKMSAIEMWVNGDDNTRALMSDFYRTSNSYNSTRNSNVTGMPQGGGSNGVSSNKTTTNYYGGFTLNNKDNKPLDITVNGTVRQGSDIEKDSNGAARIVLKDSKGGYQNAYIEVNLNNKDGKAWVKQLKSTYKDISDEKELAKKLFTDIMMSPPWNMKSVSDQTFNKFYKDGILSLPSDASQNMKNSTNNQSTQSTPTKKPAAKVKTKGDAGMG
jgi:multidrug efflux pump subunit AcrA (membrane-fusion protein)